MSEMRKLSSSQGYCEHVIDFVDVIDFFVIWWRLILLSLIIAAVAGLVYSFVTPNLYQSSGILVVAKTPLMVATVQENEGKSQTLRIDVEEIELPTLLRARMIIATTYPPDIFAECHFFNENGLSESLRLLPDNTEGTLKFSVLHRSPELSAQCAKIFFEFVKSQHAELMEERIGNVTLKVQSLKIIRDAEPTRLLAPLETKNKPVLPDRNSIVASWAALGLFLSLIYALFRASLDWYRRTKSSSQQTIN